MKCTSCGKITFNITEEGEKALEEIGYPRVKTEKEIKQAIKDSKEYLQKISPGQKWTSPTISMKDFQKGILILAVSNEICTLNWVLGKGKMNCYTMDENGKLKKELKFKEMKND